MSATQLATIDWGRREYLLKRVRGAVAETANEKLSPHHTLTERDYAQRWAAVMFREAGADYYDAARAGLSNYFRIKRTRKQRRAVARGE